MAVNARKSCSFEELKLLGDEELNRLAEEEVEALRWTRWDLYKALFEHAETRGDTTAVEKFRAEIIVNGLMPKREDARFVPMIEATTNDGKKVKIPDPDAVLEEFQLQHLRARARTSRSAITRSRYSDFLWLRKEGLSFAQAAIDAYLESVDLYMPLDWGSEYADALERALVLSLQIKDPVRVDKAIIKINETITKLCQEHRYRYLIEIAEALLSRHKQVATFDWMNLNFQIDEARKHYADNVPDSFHFERHFLELKRKISRIQDDKVKEESLRLETIKSFEAEANWKLENYPNGNLVAVGILENALQGYMDLGNQRESIERLKLRIAELNEKSKGELKRFESSFEIEAKPIKDHVEVYKGLEPTAFLVGLVCNPNLVPRWEDQIKSAREQLSEFALMRLIPMAIHKNNLKIKDLNTEEHKVVYNAIQSCMLAVQTYGSMILSELFAIFESENVDFDERLMEFFKGSQTISLTRQEFLRPALRAYKNGDYLSACHILIFQVEGSLRDMLALIMVPTFTYRSGEMRARDMNDVIATLKKVDGFDQDLAEFLCYFYCDISGFNIRNDTGHGLQTAGIYSRGAAQWMIYTLVRIACFQSSPKEESP